MPKRAGITRVAGFSGCPARLIGKAAGPSPHFVIHEQFALAVDDRFCAAGDGFTLLFELSSPALSADGQTMPLSYAARSFIACRNKCAMLRTVAGLPLRTPYD